MPRPTSLLLLSLTLVMGVSVSSDVFAQTRATLQPMDVFRFELASDPQISPDGTRVVYVRNFMDVYRDRARSHLWIVGTDGSDHRPLVADDDRNASQPRWSPDGSRIAYVSKDIESKNGPAQIYCRWLDGGQTARLTRVERAPESLTWSPDGKRLAYTMFLPEKPAPFADLPKPPEGATWADAPQVIRDVKFRADGQGYLEEGFRQVFVVSAEGGAPRAITSGRFHHEGPLAWSADGRSVYLSANRDENWEHEPRESEIYRASLDGGALVRITDRDGPDHTPAVSPDGRKLAWLGFDDRRLSEQNERLYVAGVDGGEPREVTTKFDRSVESPVWGSDGKGLFFKFDDEGTTKVGYVTLAGAVTTIADHVGGVTLGRPYASGSFSIDGRGRVAFTHSTPDRPADVAIVGSSETPVRLTRLNDDLLAQRRMSTVEQTWLPETDERRRIQYWIVKPPGFDAKKKYPLILEIHGGPFANYGDRFSLELQSYAAAGYVVVYANPRGSTGYGEEFANEIHHAYPGADYEDLMDVVDEVVAQGYVDPDQLYVTGGSGGGILTAWIVTQTNRFRAAVSVKPVINWYSFALTTDVYPYFTQYWFPGVPWEHTEHYLKRSPLVHVGNVTTPTMLMTGIEDHRTPITEAEQFYQALKLRKVDTLLVRVPEASHDIVKRPSRLMMKVAYVLKWFERHRDTPRAKSLIPR